MEAIRVSDGVQAPVLDLNEQLRLLAQRGLVKVVPPDIILSQLGMFTSEGFDLPDSIRRLYKPQEPQE